MRQTEYLSDVQKAAGKSCAMQAYGDREGWFCAADEFENAIAALAAERDRYRDALETIAANEAGTALYLRASAREALAL